LGILDHRKTWIFDLTASSDKCLDAFDSAFGTGGPRFMKAKWSITRTPKGAVASYLGRGGLIGAATHLSAMGTDEQAGAEDSEVHFEIEEAGGKSHCTMWLGVYGSRMGLTADARFIRPYMQRVEEELRRVDRHVAASTR